MRVLVTGLTGKTGRCFLAELCRRGLQGSDYRALVRETSDTRAIEQSGLALEVCRGDLDREADLARALQGMDTVLHIAGIQKSVPLVRQARKAGVKWLILVHTTGIYSKYKRAGEEYRQAEREIAAILEGTGIALTILRPTMIYGGPDDGNIAVFIRMTDRLPLFPVVSGGRFALQPVHRQDLGRAYYDVLANPETTRGNNYDLSGAYPIDLIDLLRILADELGKHTRFVTVPFFLAYAGAWALYLLTFAKLDLREKVQRLVEPRAYTHAAASRAMRRWILRRGSGRKSGHVGRNGGSKKNTAPRGIAANGGRIDAEHDSVCGRRTAHIFGTPVFRGGQPCAGAAFL